MAKTDEIKIPIWKKKLHHFLLKLEGRISKWRKRSLIIDPEIDFWVSQPLKQANVLLGKLYKNNDFYFSARYAWTGPEDSKKLLLYGYARQIMKASLTLLENEEHILEVPQKDSIDTLGRIIIEGIIDSQHIVLRKHIETLINLINLFNFDRGEAYRIFLNSENLEHFLGRQSDFGTFYESRSGNIDSSIKTYSDRIHDDLKTLKVSNIWFLRRDWDRRKSPPIFESVRKRFMEALPHATDDEKIVLGLSYDKFFGDFSASVHAPAGSPITERRQKFNTIRRNISFISLLGQHIISRANRLMNFDDPNDQIRRMARDGTSDAPKLLQRFKEVFSPGDLVLAMGDLCEIMECKQSRYDYTSCRIKFLTRPPLPETPEDWLPAAFVIMVLPKDKVRQFLFKNKDNPKTPKELKEVSDLMEKETDDKLMEYARGATVKLYQDGILIPMLLHSGVIKRKEEIDED